MNTRFEDRVARRRRSFPGSTVWCGAVVLAVLLAGCAATPPPGPASAPSSAQASTTAGVPASGLPDPNAPEVLTAGDIPDNQVFVPATIAGATFSVSVPEGWARSADGAATVFTDKYNSVRVESRPLPAAPDVASVRGQDVPQLQGSQPGFGLGDVQSVRRNAGQGVVVTYVATSAPNPVTGKSVTESVERYAFWRAGTEVVLTLAGPQGSDNVDPWRTITDSLRWQQ